MPAHSKVLIAGCGAVGSVFGCLLRKAGHDVTLLGRNWHLEAIGSGALEMDGIWGAHRADGFRLATQASDLSGPYDLIVIAVKAYDTTSTVTEVGPFLSPDGLALSVQNGLGNIEVLARAFGAERSLGASVLVGAKILGPAKVTVTVQAAPIILGPLDSAAGPFREKCEAWTAAFNAAQIPCEATDRVLSHLWAKVFYNAPLNALGALLSVHYGTLGEEPELKAIMNRIIDETFRVAEKKAVPLLWRSSEEYRELFYGKLLPATYDHQSSMLQDLEHGKLTEIDALNGRIWGYGEQLHVPTPFNEVMTRLIRQRERQLTSRGFAARKGLALDR